MDVGSVAGNMHKPNKTSTLVDGRRKSGNVVSLCPTETLVAKDVDVRKTVVKVGSKKDDALNMENGRSKIKGRKVTEVGSPCDEPPHGGMVLRKRKVSFAADEEEGKNDGVSKLNEARTFDVMKMKRVVGSGDVMEMNRRKRKSDAVDGEDRAAPVKGGKAAGTDRTLTMSKMHLEDKSEVDDGAMMDVSEGGGGKIGSSDQLDFAAHQGLAEKRVIDVRDKARAKAQNMIGKSKDSEVQMLTSMVTGEAGSELGDHHRTGGDAV